MSKQPGENEDVLHLLSKVSRHLSQSLEAEVRPKGLSLDQLKLLELLSERNGLTMGELASRIAVDAPTLTKIMDRMVANGFVYRAPDATDRRKVLIYVSEAGLAMLASVESTVRDARTRLLAGLSTNKTQELKTMLATLLDHK